MKKLFFLILAVTLFYGCPKNEEIPFFGDIYGVVSDANSGDPIRNAIVTLSPGNISVVTGTEGHFEFVELEAEQYKINVSCEGYESNTSQINVVPGRSVSCDIQLHPKSAANQFVIDNHNLAFGSNVTQIPIVITNNSLSHVRWTLNLGDNNSWLKASSVSGTIMSKRTETIIFTCNRTEIKNSIDGSILISIDSNTTPISVSCSPSQQQTSSMEITPLDIDFGDSNNKLSFTIKNISSSDLNWSLSDISNEPFSVSKNSGIIKGGDKDQVIISLDRSKITSDYVTSFKVYDGTNEQQVNVYVETPDSESESDDVAIEEIIISTDHLDFGNDKSELSFTINTGNIGAHVGLVGLQNDLFYIDDLNGMIEANTTKYCKIYLDRSQLIGDFDTIYDLYASYDNGVEKKYPIRITALQPNAEKKPESHKIYYTTNNGYGITFYNFSSSVISHTFSNNKGVITFAEPLTSIADGAFIDCENLLSISMPETVNAIGFDAFAECVSLQSINIPNGVKTIADSSFRNCGSLKKITLSQNLESIGYEAFAYCGLSSITIPKSVKEIGGNAFSGCRNLVEIIFESETPPNMRDAFRDINPACKIQVPDGAYNNYAKYDVMGDYVEMVVNPDDGEIEGFEPDNMPNNQIWYISKDRQIIKPTYTTAFGKAAIQSNKYENDKGVITFDSDVTTISAEAFAGIENLTRIIIPKSVISIKNKAFYGCSDLSSIIIPESVTTIGENVFDGCTSLAAFYGKFASADNRFLVINGVLSSFASSGAPTSITIPEGVTSISDNIFANTQIESVSFPNSLITIGNSAFAHTRLLSVTIPENVTTIGDGAFYNTPITEVTSRAKNLVRVGIEAFASCYDLESADFKSIKNIAQKAFDQDEKLKIVTLPDTETVGSCAFRWCDLRSLILPKTLKTAEYEAFSLNENLKEVTVIAGVSYHDRIFHGCSSLSHVDIEDGVTIIPQEMFDNSGVSEISFPASVIEIGDGAFNNCRNLREIVIPGTVEAIGRSAFSNSHLMNVILNEGLKSVADYAFEGTPMYEITLPKSLESIGERAFVGENLEEVYSPRETPAILDSGYNNEYLAFGTDASKIKIYVPASAIEAYKSADGWSFYIDSITAYDFSAE